MTPQHAELARLALVALCTDFPGLLNGEDDVPGADLVANLSLLVNDLVEMGVNLRDYEVES